MKMTHHGMMVRVLAAALAVGSALPAFAQDDQRWRDRQGERGEREGDAEREELRRQRQERREERAAEAQGRGEAAQQQAPRQERYNPEEQRRQVYERAADPQQQPRIEDRERRWAEQREQQQQQQQQVQLQRDQQQVQLQRDPQLRQDEARRVEQQRQERYGYGESREGSRDWNDGNRRAEQGRDDRGGDRDWNRDRDGRDGNRDRDGRSDRDGRGGRYGRNDRDGRRWDNDSQRRWDGWQRDADRYRREAMQRHNANRYASLQQQRRMSQYRYQQDYWNRQQRWYSGWNSRRYDRNFVIAPIVYRYSRGGRWYDVNRYAADTLQEAIRIGYSEGARAGDADRMDGWRGGYRDNFVYQDADFGYDGYYVSLSEYQYYFREGFRRGYDDAYGRRYRYGRHSNGDWIIAAATLGLILNLQDY